MKIQLLCEKCGKEAEVDKKGSSKNWTKLNTKQCKHCGHNKFEFKVAK